MIPQLLSALVAVLLLMGALAWLAKRMRLPNLAAGTPSTLSVRSSLNIGQREKLVVVQFGSQEILLGVTSSQIQTLAKRETDPSAPQEIIPEVTA